LLNIISIFHLDYTISVVLSPKYPSIEVPENGAIELLCLAQGYPKNFHIEWRKNKNEIPHLEQPQLNKSLLVPDQIVNSETFVCKATNDAGSDAKQVTVIPSGECFFNFMLC